MNMIASKIVTPDGTILQSFYRHDFKSHKDLNGKEYCIDGGLDYQRIIGDISDLEIIQITDEDNFEVIRQEMYWGTYGKDGTEKFKYIYLNEMEKLHIIAVLETQQQLPKWKHDLLRKELDYRLKNNISL